jgi:hypothetical protein
METLACLVIQFGPKFQVFIPMIQRTIAKHNIKHTRYDTLILYKCKDDYYSEGEDSEINQLSKIKQRTYSRSRNMMGLTEMDTYLINRVLLEKRIILWQLYIHFVNHLSQCSF